MEDDELITQWGLFVEAYSLASRRLEAELAAKSDLPILWFETLLRLERTPGHRLPMTQLANDVLLTSGGFTKLADRLTEAGLVERIACPSDRRVTWMTLTASGVKTARAAKRAHVQSLRALINEHLGETELARVGVSLRKLRDGLSQQT